MIMTKAKPKAAEPLPDRGCFVAPRCTGCPLRVCVLEAPAPELAAFRSAWRTIARYVAPVDTPIDA